MMKNARALAILVLCCFLAPAGYAAPPVPRINIILMIGDGMGFEQLKVASLYETGKEGKLSFQDWPAKGELTTASYAGGLTDSAAAATAMATGRKVNNKVLSVAVPGNKAPYETILELAKKNNYWTGLVSTVNITDATPAAFAAHVNTRASEEAIANAFLMQSRPHLLFGGAGKFLTAERVKTGGYYYINDIKTLSSHSYADQKYVAALYGSGDFPYLSEKNDKYPTLTEMSRRAVEFLADRDKGFFLMIEGGLIDHGGHNNNVQDIILETIAFSQAVKRVQEWAKGRKDTLIIVTADHETGGLKLLKDKGKGQLPEVSFSTKGHTPVNVPVFAWGYNAERFKGVHDNTDVYKILRELYGL
jgi:alkaline phosphatase